MGSEILERLMMARDFFFELPFMSLSSLLVRGMAMCIYCI